MAIEYTCMVSRHEGMSRKPRRVAESRETERGGFWRFGGYVRRGQVVKVVIFC